MTALYFVNGLAGATIGMLPNGEFAGAIIPNPTHRMGYHVYIRTRDDETAGILARDDRPEGCAHVKHSPTLFLARFDLIEAIERRFQP